MTNASTATVRFRDPSEEAATLLGEIVDGLSRPDHDLKLLLRRALHVCNLGRWTKETPWLTCELYGYSESVVLPWYRENLPVARQWRPHGAYDLAEHAINSVVDGKKESTTEYQSARWGIDELIQYSMNGVYIPTGKEETRRSGRRGHDVPGQEVISYSKQTLQRVVANLENDLFRWASNAYATMNFGDAVSDIWRSYRAVVDTALTRIGLSDVLRQIDSGLLSSNPEAWRQSMISCRNLLNDVAAHLWRDPRKTYALLQNEKGEDIKVTEDMYVNRLIAYLHQKGVVGATGDHLKAQWRSLRRLNDLGSSAKDANAVTLEDARSTVIAAYVALGELFHRTDGVPIENYS